MQGKADNLARENGELRTEVTRLHGELGRLNEQLEWFRNQVFGRKSERFVDVPNQTELLPGMDLPEPPEPPKPVVVPRHTRAKTRRKGTCTVQIPDDLDRVEVLVDVPESERILPDGTPLVRIGEDRSEKLAHRPGEYYMLVTIRPKYADPRDPRLDIWGHTYALDFSAILFWISHTVLRSLASVRRRAARRSCALARPDTEILPSRRARFVAVYRPRQWLIAKWSSTWRASLFLLHRARSRRGVTS
jgi:hypothetical protein